MKNYIPLFFAFLFMCSCHTQQVYNGSKRSNKVPGIPFYVQKEIFTQETQYLYSWYEVEFKKSFTIEGKKIDTTLFKTQIINSDSVYNLQQRVYALKYVKYKFLDSAVSVVMDSLTKYPHISKTPKSTELDTISNSWKPEVAVDYTTKYYLNSRIPVFGSATQTQKLSDKGTLTETSVTIDSQLDELATAAVALATPLASITVADINTKSAERIADLQKEKGYIEKKNQEDALEPLSKMIDVNYSLKVEEKGYLYSFKQVLCDSNCAEYRISRTVPCIPFDLTGNYTRVAYPPAAKKKEEEKPSIKVSGNIQLPESKNQK